MRFMIRRGSGRSYDGKKTQFDYFLLGSSSGGRIANYLGLIVRRLLDEGFELISIAGSHHKFRKGTRTVIVPHPKKDFTNWNCTGDCQASGLD
jgi:HicA toxin of bacterial toxin-antitoxin,